MDPIPFGQTFHQMVKSGLLQTSTAHERDDFPGAVDPPFYCIPEEVPVIRPDPAKLG